MLDVCGECYESIGFKGILGKVFGRMWYLNEFKGCVV